MEQIRNRKSYQSILKSAKKLFMKFSIKKVSVEEICKNASISKMTFYRTFKNKRELIVEMLNTLFEKGLSDYKNIMNQEINFSEKVKQIIILKHESVEDIGTDFVTEIYQSDDEELQKIIDGYMEKSNKEIYKDFSIAQKEGWIRSDIKLDSIFYFLNIIHEKILDPNYIRLHNNMHDAIMEMTNFFFYGIVNQEN